MMVIWDTLPQHVAQKLIVGVSEKKAKAPLLNSMALHTGQEASLVWQNRNDHFGESNSFGDLRFVTMDQTHSSTVVTYEEKSGNAKSERWTELRQEGGVDGVLTQQKRIVLCVMSADCVPLLLYDSEQEVAGAIHVGWRGAASGIVSKAIDTMCKHYGSRSEAIFALIAPAIKGCCYEVGDEVVERLGKVGALCAEKKSCAEKWLLDMPRVVATQLMAKGLQKSRIHQSGICTACDNTRFFSYRKEKCSGRFLSYIGMRG